MVTPKRVLIVGAGCSGLTAIKACLEEDLVPLCLEKTTDIGGLWNYSPNASAPGTAGIYESLVINTCREMMAFSDFPVPDSVPQFMTHRHVLRYFRLYARHFSLLPYIRFNTEVRCVRKADDYNDTGRWLVTYVSHALDSCPTKCVNADKLNEEDGARWHGNGDIQDDGTATAAETDRDNSCGGGGAGKSRHGGEEDESVRGRSEGDDEMCRVVSEMFDGVMICSGHHTVPYMPSLTGMGAFQGRVIHSQDYKRPEPFVGQRVLIVGIGNSAVDIASDLAKSASKVYLSTRRGSWIVGRTMLGGMPADMLANSRVVFSLPTCLLEWCLEKQVNARMDHDRLGLTPAHSILGAHPTINDEIPFHLLSRRVEIVSDVAKVLPGQVQLKDGNVLDVDTIIMATGYDYRLDFVDSRVLKVQENRVRLYKYVFPPGLPHPTLAVVGLVQAIGAVMPISELQCRWFANLMIGRVKLPDIHTMHLDIERKEQAMNRKYYSSRRHTLQTFWIDYMDQLAEQIGARPNLLAMLFRDPGLSLRCFLGPCLPAQYRLQGPRPWPHAARFIKDVGVRHSTRPPATRNPYSQSDSRSGGPTTTMGGVLGERGGARGYQSHFTARDRTVRRSGVKMSAGGRGDGVSNGFAVGGGRGRMSSLSVAVGRRRTRVALPCCMFVLVLVACWFLRLTRKDYLMCMVL